MEDKYIELLKYSNPDKVLKNAKKIYGKDIKLSISTRKNKKYMIYDDRNNKWIHFGSFNPPMEDYTYHNDQKRQLNYLSRATKIKGNWKSNPYSPNNLSIKLLWS